MKQVLILGATGMIGNLILQECLTSSEIKKVTSIVRRTSGIVHSKLHEIVHDNFLDYSNIEDQFVNQNIAFFCIGVYTGQVSDQKFKTITSDFTIAFADMLRKNSPHSTVCFLSGAGADQTEKSKVSFARYKGMAENYLVSKGFNQLYIFRPGYIYPVIKRKEPNFSYSLFRFLYPLIKLLGKRYSIKSTELAKAMFNIGINGSQGSILENPAIIDSIE